MTQVDFQSIFDTLKKGVAALAEEHIKEYAKQAKGDGEQMLNGMKTKLERYAQQFKNGEITKDELEFQIGTEKALLKMAILKQKGIAQIHLDKFKRGIINLITDTLSKVI